MYVDGRLACFLIQAVEHLLADDNRLPKYASDEYHGAVALKKLRREYDNWNEENQVDERLL